MIYLSRQECIETIRDFISLFENRQKACDAIGISRMTLRAWEKLGAHNYAMWGLKYFIDNKDTLINSSTSTVDQSPHCKL